MSTNKDSFMNQPENAYSYPQQFYPQQPYPQPFYPQQIYAQPPQYYPPMEYQMPFHQNFNQINQKKVDEDAAALRKAMKGLGTDEQSIIDIVGNSTNRERLAMIESFKRQFNRDLIADLKSELSGHFKDAIKALFKDPIEYDCYSLNKSLTNFKKEYTVPLNFMLVPSLFDRNIFYYFYFIIYFILFKLKFIF